MTKIEIINPAAISEARILKGKSVVSLSREIHVNHTALGRIENSQKFISPRAAKAICDALSLRFEDVFAIRRGGK